MKKKLRDTLMGRDGFTLVEALVATIIFSFIMLATYSIFNTSQSIQSAGMDLSEAQQNARISLDSVEREIRLAGFGIEPTVEVPILVASQYRITFVRDLNGNGAVDIGERITYFLDPEINTFTVLSTPNPRDMVIRRTVSTAYNPTAAPISGDGEIIASGITQQTDDDGSLDVPLFNYFDATGASLIDEDTDDPYSADFGHTVSDSAAMGWPIGGTKDVQIATIGINVVSESEAKDKFQNAYERVSLATSVSPRNLPLNLTLASNNTFIPAEGTP